jgi:hypothetical protein
MEEVLERVFDLRARPDGASPTHPADGQQHGQS